MIQELKPMNFFHRLISGIEAATKQTQHFTRSGAGEKPQVIFKDTFAFQAPFACVEDFHDVRAQPVSKVAPEKKFIVR
jgi:hypothetical protein